MKRIKTEEETEQQREREKGKCGNERREKKKRGQIVGEVMKEMREVWFGEKDQKRKKD